MSETAAYPRLNSTQWLICIIASIGFAFDIYELLMLPLIIGPALLELLQLKPGDKDFEIWVGLLFFVPALIGGVFGLIGGYLTDVLGRRRVLVWSILLYAFSACAAGFSTSATMLLILRCTTFIGVCVEFVAAVAWLSELFPHGKQREAILGYTQAFSSVGGLLVTGANYLAVVYGKHLPEIAGGHEAWRYTLISGVLPAIPLILIRPFLPESPIWAQKKASGTLGRPSIFEIFHPQYRRATIITALMFACSYGAAFGAIQHIPRIVPGLPQVQAEIKELPAPEKRKHGQKVAAKVQAYQEVGGLVGRFALAFLAVRIASRRNLLRIFQFPGLFIVPLVFWFPAVTDLEMLKYGMFLVGFLTVAQFSFWGNYLPCIYPTRLRGTGESFAANIGGRVFGTSAALVTTTIASQISSSNPSIPGPTVIAYVAGGVGLSVYLIGFIASFWLPEPKEETMME